MSPTVRKTTSKARFEVRNGSVRRFHNALMLGQVEERVRIMAEMGQVPLAALTAKAHQLKEYMDARTLLNLAQLPRQGF